MNSVEEKERFNPICSGSDDEQLLVSLPKAGVIVTPSTWTVSCPANYPTFSSNPLSFTTLDIQSIDVEQAMKLIHAVGENPYASATFHKIILTPELYKALSARLDFQPVVSVCYRGGSDKQLLSNLKLDILIEKRRRKVLDTRPREEKKEHSKSGNRMRKPWGTSPNTTTSVSQSISISTSIVQVANKKLAKNIDEIQEWGYRNVPLLPVQALYPDRKEPKKSIYSHIKPLLSSSDKFNSTPLGMIYDQLGEDQIGRVHKGVFGADWTQCPWIENISIEALHALFEHRYCDFDFQNLPEGFVWLPEDREIKDHEQKESKGPARRRSLHFQVNRVSQDQKPRLAMPRGGGRIPQGEGRVADDRSIHSGVFRGPGSVLP